MGFSLRRRRHMRCGDGTSVKRGGPPCMKGVPRSLQDFAKESRRPSERCGTGARCCSLRRCKLATEDSWTAAAMSLASHQSASAVEPAQYRVGDLTIDLGSQRVTRGDHEISLP